MFFFNDTATTEIYTLSLHDALPICAASRESTSRRALRLGGWRRRATRSPQAKCARSEEHTSELQSPWNLVCPLPLQKKKHSGRAEQYEQTPSLAASRRTRTSPFAPT